MCEKIESYKLNFTIFANSQTKINQKGLLDLPNSPLADSLKN